MKNNKIYYSLSEFKKAFFPKEEKKKEITGESIAKDILNKIEKKLKKVIKEKNDY